MSSNIEMRDLSQKNHATEDIASTVPTGPDITSTDEHDQSVAYWAYAATIILSIFSFVLIFTPGVLLFLSETSADRRNALTPLESFLALHGGIFLLCFSLALLFNVPNESIISTQSKAATVAHPLLVPLTATCTTSAFISYNTRSVSSLATVVFVGAAAIGGWGIWTTLFAGSSYHSRKTGADKRTSRFLFGNKSAASAQKKQWKKEQRTS